MSEPLLAAKLIDLRKHHNYSQQDIASYLDMTREGYSNYERATREPSLATTLKLCKLYQIDISELINERTILLHNTKNKPTINGSSAAPLVGAGMAAAIGPANISMGISASILHLLKLFSEKNSKVNLTDVSKDDIAFLAEYKQLDKQSQKEILAILTEYKQLDKQNQKEVRQFIKFKKLISKKK